MQLTVYVWVSGLSSKFKLALHPDKNGRHAASAKIAKIIAAVNAARFFFAIVNLLYHARVQNATVNLAYYVGEHADKVAAAHFFEG